MSTDPARGLARLGASIFDRGLTHGRTGNLSVRDGDRVLTTPTGVSLGHLDPEALSVLDPDGRHVGGPPPSKEAFLHAAVYRARPEAGAVVHLHSTHAVAVSCLADLDPDDVLPPLTAYFVMRVGRLPLVPYHAPGDASLEETALAVAERSRSFLIANHGPVVSGPDLASAADAAEELEETARLFLLLRGLTARPLDHDQVADLQRRYPA